MLFEIRRWNRSGAAARLTRRRKCRGYRHLFRRAHHRRRLVGPFGCWASVARASSTTTTTPRFQCGPRETRVRRVGIERTCPACCPLNFAGRSGMSPPKGGRGVSRITRRTGGASAVLENGSVRLGVLRAGPLIPLGDLWNARHDLARYDGEGVSSRF